MNKRFILILGFILLAIALVAGLFYLRKDSSPAPVTTVRLAYRPLALADTTPVILKERGFASQEVAIELVPVPSPQVAIQRFDAGEVDAIAGLTMEAVLQRLASHPDPEFRAFYFQADIAGKEWVSIVASHRLADISIQGLAGKTVASLPTDQARYLVRRILQAAGVSDSEIRIVDYNPTTPLLGLEAGEHDALFGLEPAISRAVAQGHRVIAQGPVSHYLFSDSPVPLSASVIRTTFAKQHPDAYRAFLELYREAVAFQASHPAEVREYFSKTDYGGLEPNVRQRLALPTLVEPTAPGILDTLKRFVADLREAGLLKTDVDVGKLLE